MAFAISSGGAGFLFFFYSNLSLLALMHFANEVPYCLWNSGIAKEAFEWVVSVAPVGGNYLLMSFVDTNTLANGWQK